MEASRLKGRIVFVAGMSRAGTTFLYHNLQKHPKVFVAGRKEICYFAHNYDQGFEWFSSFYEDLAPDQVAFDICGVYFMEPSSADRILEFDEEAKVIIGLRDPSTWIFSLYEQYEQQFQVPPFAEFLEGCTIRREGKEIKLSFERHKMQETVERFRGRFGKNLMLYDFGLLGREPLLLLRAIEEFADLEPYFEVGNFTDARINARERQRIPFLDRFMHLPGVASFIGRVVPRSVVLRLRSAIETRSVKDLPKARRTDQRYTQEELARVEQLFGPDRQYVRATFDDGPVVIGSGSAGRARAQDR